MSEQPGQRPQSTDLAAELRELGQQIEQTVRTALQSDQARAVKDNLSAGMQEIGKQVQVAIRTLQENPKVQEMAERGQRAVEQAQHSQAIKDFQDSLATGIAQLNERLSAFVDRMEQRTGSSSTTQNVPVEDESTPVDTSYPPATGPTTRLDDEI